MIFVFFLLEGSFSLVFFLNQDGQLPVALFVKLLMDNYGRIKLW